MSDDLIAGAKVVAVVDPRGQIVTLHRPNAEPQVLGSGDMLTIEEIVPGFQLPVAELF